MECDRCHREASVYVGSYFNEHMLCFDCKNDEKGCPNWAKAYNAETAAVRDRNFNFPGIGLAAEDQAYLDERLKARAEKTDAAG